MNPAIGLSVEQFGVLYWIPIGLLLLLTPLLIILCKKKGEVFTHRFLIVMFSANFLLHFLKQVIIPSYIEKWPGGLVSSTAENFCAFMVLFSPLFYLSKNKFLRDYLFYMGIPSALAAYMMPTSPSTVDLLTPSGFLEVTRYYLCHAPIFYGGILMVASGIHKLSYKRYAAIPFMILIVLGLVWSNNALWNFAFHNFEWSELLSRDNPFMNSSYPNGPGVNLDATLGGIYPYLIPFLQTYKVDGVIYFTPIIWTLPLLIIISIVLFPALCLPFTLKDMKEDIARRKKKKQETPEV